MPRGRALRDLPVRLTGKRLYPELRVWPSGLSVPRGFRLVPAGHQPVLRDAEAAVFLQFLIRAALLAKFLSKPTHTFPNRILPVAYFPALHPPCHLPLYAGCFPKFCLLLLLHVTVSVFGM